MLCKARLKLKLNPTLETTLENLCNNRNIVIEACDKGDCIYFLNTVDNISKIKELLNDRRSYKSLQRYPTNAISNDIASIIQYLHHKHLNTDLTKKLLTPPQTFRTPLFYGLLKTY